jgi:hypothetical protein
VEKRTKARKMQGFRPQGASYLKLSEWLARHAVLIAPVSSPDSLQTGNFSGNGRYLVAWDTACKPKALHLQRIRAHSLPKITEKLFGLTGYLARRNRESRRRLNPSVRVGSRTTGRRSEATMWKADKRSNGLLRVTETPSLSIG